MGQIEDLQSKGFGSHGGKQYTVDHDITPLKKRVLVSKMHFAETKSKGGIILIDDDGSEGGIQHPSARPTITCFKGSHSFQLLTTVFIFFCP